MQLSLLYWCIRATVSVVRFLTRFNIGVPPRRTGILPASISTEPSSVERIPSSTEATREVICHVYGAVSNDLPQPVHINLSAGGFIVGMLGQNAEWCTFLAMKADCVVLDVGYALAPERPFPAAYNDVLDVLAFIHARPSRFDSARITIGGFSAGANLALAVSAHVPRGSVQAVYAHYPIVDFSDFIERNATVPLARGAPGFALPAPMRHLMASAYIPPDADMLDPRISPGFAAADAFPRITLVVGECDPCAHGCSELARKVQSKGSGHTVTLMVIPGAGHAWDGFVQPGTSYERERDDVNDFIVREMCEMHPQ